MPLLSAPLPRMAGRLTFMRSRQRKIEDIGAGDLAVLGLPFEDHAAPYPGQHLAARAIRETSVYFGWHANPQFSHPVDIASRRQVETAGLHERLSDIGDLSPEEQNPASALADVAATLSQRGACLVILGGPRWLSEQARHAAGALSTVQMGGAATDPAAFHISPSSNDSNARHVAHAGKVSESEMPSALSDWHTGQAPIFLNFDLSVFSASLAALCDRPRLGGCGLVEVAGWMTALGRLPVRAVHVTGLNPTRPGMGVVKVGQRLAVTALLPFIYSKLGFTPEVPEQFVNREQEQ
jgi:agmatinase